MLALAGSPSLESRPHRQRIESAPRFFPLLILALCGLAACDRPTQTVRLRLQPNEPAKLQLTSSLDDSHFREPRGFHPLPPPEETFLDAFTISNAGDTPVRNLRLEVNGRETNTFDGLQTMAAASSDSAESFLKQFFHFWSLQRFHASTGLAENKQFFPARNLYGFTLCYDDCRALGQFFQTAGIESRTLNLNGHAVGVYWIDGAWRVLDGDQVVYYPQWDSDHLATLEEMLADPLLILRAKPLGRHETYDLAKSRFNTSLFELATSQRDLVPKELTFSPPQRDEGFFDLYPGEELRMLYAVAPDAINSRFQMEAFGPAVESALRVVELHTPAAVRGQVSNGILQIESWFPLSIIINRTTGVGIRQEGNQAIYEAQIPVNSNDDEIILKGYMALTAMPAFQRGDNQLVVHGQGDAPLEINISWVRYREKPPAPPAPGEIRWREGELVMKMRAVTEGDRIWWQIARDKDFLAVNPAFDTIEKFDQAIVVEALPATLLRDGTYWMRAKVQENGRWSSWSDPHAFEVSRPSRPVALTATPAAHGQVHLRWQSPHAGQFRVFGSNAMDFVPQLFNAQDITQLDRWEAVESVPNDNFLTMTHEHSAVVPPYHFYRVLAIEGEQISQPSPLLRLPDQMTASLPDPTVLQTRWSMEKDTQQKLGYRDIYETERHKVIRDQP